MNLTVSLDNQSYRSKPTKWDIAEISGRIAASQCSANIQELACKIGEEGHTFCPAVFRDGERKRDNFLEMQVFAIDFDGGISYQAVKDLCNSYELPISFSYHTYSSNEENPKFRVVFTHGGIIRNQNIAELMLVMLKRLFPKSDKNCYELSRMYFGGKGVIELNKDTAFRMDRLAYYYQINLGMQQTNQYSREIKNIAKKYNIDLLAKNILNICAYDCGALSLYDENQQKNVEKMISSNIIYI